MKKDLIYIEAIIFLSKHGIPLIITEVLNWFIIVKQKNNAQKNE